MLIYNVPLFYGFESELARPYDSATSVLSVVDIHIILVVELDTRVLQSVVGTVIVDVQLPLAKYSQPPAQRIFTSSALTSVGVPSCERAGTSLVHVLGLLQPLRTMRKAFVSSESLLVTTFSCTKGS